MIKLELISGGGAIDDAKYVTITKGVGKALKFSTSIWTMPAQYVVTGIDWKESIESSAGKTITGAAVGGILAGPVGIAAGALLGSKKKDRSIAVITVDIDAGETNIHVRCNAKEFQQLNKLIK